MDDKVFEFMTKMYSDISLKLETMDKKLETMDKKLDLKSDKTDIVKLENSLDINSKALFDGYNQLYEKVILIEKEVKELSSKVEKQDVEIKVIKGGKP
ncbi:UNVERIFIED_CONTAM: hypothetical protein Cloal_2126 [Acetivibrio alkalicellulosi]